MITEVQEWVRSIAHTVHPPVLEVGSYDVNGGVRESFPDMHYVGLDMREGPGVDVVADIVYDGVPSIYNTVLCLETLEHVREPWLALERMHGALLPGGAFIGSWVCSWPVHDYPSDYYRVTPEGFRYLLERAGFVDVETTLGGKPDTHVYATARRAA